MAVTLFEPDHHAFLEDIANALYLCNWKEATLLARIFRDWLYEQEEYEEGDWWAWMQFEKAEISLRRFFDEEGPRIPKCSIDLVWTEVEQFINERGEIDFHKKVHSIGFTSYGGKLASWSFCRPEEGEALGANS